MTPGTAVADAALQVGWKDGTVAGRIFRKRDGQSPLVFAEGGVRAEGERTETNTLLRCFKSNSRPQKSLENKEKAPKQEQGDYLTETNLVDPFDHGSTNSYVAGVPGLEPRKTEGLWRSGLLRANLLEPRIHAVPTAPVYGLSLVDSISFGPCERIYDPVANPAGRLVVNAKVGVVGRTVTDVSRSRARRLCEVLIQSLPPVRPPSRQPAPRR